MSKRHPFFHLFVASFAYLFYALFRLLPIEIASMIGGLLARLIGPHLSVHRIALENISHAFPLHTSVERAQILSRMWDNLGRTVAEFPHIATLSEKQFDALVDVRGAEHLEIIKQRGAIFISGHLANWEIAPKCAARFGTPLALIYRPANNPWIERLIQQHRHHYQSDHLPKGVRGARKALKVLQEGKTLGLLVDQKMNDGIAVPFFGRDAMTAPAVAALALKYECPIISAHVIRNKGARFTMIIDSPFYLHKTDDEKTDIYNAMRNINAMLERWITAHPDQWFWVHKRWPKEREGTEK